MTRVWPKVASTFPEELIRQHKITTWAWCEIESGRLLILCVGKGPLPYLFQPCTIDAAWRPLDDRFIVTTAVLLMMTFSYGRVERLWIKQLADLLLWLRLSCPSPSQAPGKSVFFDKMKHIQCPDPEGCLFKTAKTSYLLLLSLNFSNHNFHADDVFNSLGDL